MDEQLQTTSTSPGSIFSELSSHDSMFSNGIVPTTSVLSPLRSSITLTDMNDVANTLTYRNFFDNEFNTQRFSMMSRWQSDAENLNLQFDSSSKQSSRYVVKDSPINQNIASSSITDLLVSPVSQLSASSSIMSLHSIGNPKPFNQQIVSAGKHPMRNFLRFGESRPASIYSTDKFNFQNENINLFSPTSAFSPVSNRPTLSTIDNMFSNIITSDLPRVPSSFQIVQPSSTYGHTSMLRPQSNLVHTAARSNSMPTWRGYLPIKLEPITAQFSQKVFLGGIPIELTEAELLLVLRKFGKCNIKWPKNDGLNHNMPGFCHVIFREARSVCELLKHCTRQQQQRSTIDYFLHIHMSPTSSVGLSLRPNRLKPIQVVPWNMRDNVYVSQPNNTGNAGDTSYKDWSRTIFVSPLHGKMTAYSLSTIMSNVFGSVSMVQINTDKYGYPTGTGTVLFCDSHSYMRAVAAGAIDIKCDCFHKLLDIDPFLRENEVCSYCGMLGDLFCRNFHCLRSYCRECWVKQHGPAPLADHQPATRRQQPLPHL